MPIPLLLIGAAVSAGIAGIAKGGQAISNNNKAKELLSDAQYEYENAQRRLEYQKNQTSNDLNQLGKTKIRSWADDIGQFVELFKHFKKVRIEGAVNFNKNLKMVPINSGNLKNMEIAAVKAQEIVKAGVASLGVGALAGIASYGGAMMFASASTGTAIATLSGAAATNATLAWFGGGSLAAGGLGVAGGSLVLGGIVAGPVLAVAGFIMAAKSEENLASARKAYSEAKLAVEKMDTMTDFMNRVSQISNNYDSFISQFSIRYQPMLEKISIIHKEALEKQERLFSNRLRKVFGLKVKVNFEKLSPENQQALQVAWLMTQVLYAVLSAPILTKSGDIDANAESAIAGAKDMANNLIGESC